MPAPKKPTPKRGFLFLLGGLLAGCGSSSLPSSAPDSATVRIAHLTDYAWQDRNRTGQPVDFKPEAECLALYQSLQSPQTEHLLVRGIGSQAAFAHLTEKLTSEHPSWEGIYFPGPTPYEGLGFFLQKPQVPAQNQVSINLSEERYVVQGRTYAPLAAGCFTGDYWLWNVVWPEPSANYERRRNEARLLVQALRPILQAGEEIILSLHSREHPDSPMFRMLEDVGLVHVRAEDDTGDQWTYRDPEGIRYRKDQWVFATPELAKTLTGRILDSPAIREAGDYRHQTLTLIP